MTVYSTRSVSGFILPELIAAIAIMALLVAMMTGGIRLMMIARLSSDHAVLNVTQNAGLAAIETLLDHVVEKIDAASSGQADTGFRGSSQGFSALFLSEATIATGGYARLSVQSVISNAKAHSVTLTIQPWRRNRISQSPSASQTLFVAEEFEPRFQYFGVTTDDKKPKWVSDWSDQPRLPLLLKIEMINQDGISASTYIYPIGGRGMNP